MSFSKLKLPESITTGYQDPCRDFFIPLLENAKSFDVAVGYFTAGWLRDVAEGMAAFAINGGRSRWVISPQLQVDDANAIVEGSLDQLLLNERNKIEDNLLALIKDLKSEPRTLLCNLIKAKVLSFKYAVARTNSTGMLHAKMGIALDVDNQPCAFSGSYNLTAHAKSNWEHIDVFQGYGHSPENSRVDLITIRFNRLWFNEDPSFYVCQPSARLLKAMEVYTDSTADRFLNSVKGSSLPLKLRAYQNEAIKNWFQNNGKGMYVMATGSGKTITALATVYKLKEALVERKRQGLVVVFVLPLKHLLEQWVKEAELFGFETIKCYESSNAWKKLLSSALVELSASKQGCVMAMVTNATLSSDAFQRYLKSINSNFLIVADEAHNLGSKTYLDALPSNAHFRLGLTATPMRHNDEEGTEALMEYFDKPVINFTLEDAISNGFLCKYEYHPHVCELTYEEYDEYLELSHEISLESGKSEAGKRTALHNQLLRQRTELIAGVSNKLVILREQIKQQKSSLAGLKHTLVYCGAMRDGDDNRHIERVLRIVGVEAGLKVRKFTADESMEERREILDLFSKGELECITAIKCLDEGVDVPATRVAYILASTTNPREFIQRRGRVLRQYPGKDKAVIYDFIVTPPAGSFTEPQLVERELQRGYEYASLATNKTDCLALFEDLAQKYGVDINETQ
ncbi:DEAD/DEAH box helicase family protein [Shewanella colwelliana]|uniref:DEAD/DEAH box helicase family protein n=1 Tax=Shewanella colwelliana TaxID=23 RepID=UPI00299F3983|nr:DEAD/DEAH box helicase family protein [Shewanella colwelliana]MDX1282979.1 DEAD/DEAH box helicase family protein [Shewanella colwelliana]